MQTHPAQDKFHMLTPLGMGFLSWPGLIAFDHQVRIAQEFFQKTAAILMQGGAQSLLQPDRRTAAGLSEPLAS